MSVLCVSYAIPFLLTIFGAEDAPSNGPPLLPPPADSREAPERLPTLKTEPTTNRQKREEADPARTSSKSRHYIIQIKLIEVDETGRESLLGSPQIKTTGGNAGISVDHPDGRRFDFTVKLHHGRGDVSGDSSSGEATPELISLTDQDTSSVESKLSDRISLKLAQRSRRDVLKELSRQTEINIAIDPECAKSAKNLLDMPIDLEAKDERISSIIDRVIQPLALGHIVKHDMVLIANAEKLLPEPEEYSVRTYNVGSLVVQAGNSQETKPNFEPLIQRIKLSVAPDSWDRQGSAATIRPFNSTQSLVVRQTRANHTAIERLLEKLQQQSAESGIDRR